MTLDAITRDQADALAAFAVTLRPGQRAWTKAAVLDQIGRVKDNPGLSSDVEVIARAVMRAARTATIRTPQVISMTGEHWEDKHVDPLGDRRLFRCPRCGRIDHDTGANCHPPPVTGPDRRAQLAALRVARIDARARRIADDMARREAREGTAERLAAAEGTTLPPGDAETLERHTGPARESVHNRSSDAHDETRTA